MMDQTETEKTSVLENKSYVDEINGYIIKDNVESVPPFMPLEKFESLEQRVKNEVPLQCEGKELRCPVKEEKHTRSECEIDPISVLQLSMRTKTEVGDVKESLDKMVQICEKNLHNDYENIEEQANNMTYMKNEPCETVKLDFDQQISCKHGRDQALACVICSSLVKINKLLNNVEMFYRCKSCDKSFSYKCDLTSHQLEHSNSNFPCNICNKSFSHKFLLTRHMKIHNDDKPFLCSYCNKTFTQKCHLRRHIAMHTGSKPFTCNLCDKSFCYKCDLTKHLRIHIGEKTFSCNICRKCFFHKSQLAKHVRIHTGEKPFVCNICSRSYSQKSHLNVHMLIHTGQKSFTCNICNRSFLLRTHLATHMRIHQNHV